MSNYFLIYRVILLDFDTLVKVKSDNELIFIVNFKKLDSFINIQILIIQFT